MDKDFWLVPVIAAMLVFSAFVVYQMETTKRLKMKIKAVERVRKSP
jgi:hypothetical protein